MVLLHAADSFNLDKQKAFPEVSSQLVRYHRFLTSCMEDSGFCDCSCYGQTRASCDGMVHIVWVCKLGVSKFYSYQVFIKMEMATVLSCVPLFHV